MKLILRNVNGICGWAKKGYSGIPASDYSPVGLVV